MRMHMGDVLSTAVSINDVAVDGGRCDDGTAANDYVPTQCPWYQSLQFKTADKSCTCQFSPSGALMNVLALPGAAAITVYQKVSGKTLDLGWGGGPVVIGLGAALWIGAFFLFTGKK